MTEKDLGIWGMTQFNLADAGLPIRGDLGIGYVKTDQFSTGYASRSAATNLVSADRTYKRWLPSVNLVGNITDDLQVRYAAAKTLARAGISSLTPGSNLNVLGGNRSLSSGNPDLKPTPSKNLDVSIEWYPTQGAIYALAAFRKDIGTFVQTLSVGVPYTSLGLPNSLLDGTTASPTDVFIVSQPVNSSGGIPNGFEVNIQQPFSFLPGALANFGVLANYTFVKSDIEYLTAVPGTEGNAYNGTNRTINVDAQASYNITEKMKLSIEAINLTDTKEDQFVDETNRLNVLTHSGRQFNFGMRYAF